MKKPVIKSTFFYCLLLFLSCFLVLSVYSKKSESSETTYFESVTSNIVKGVVKDLTGNVLRGARIEVRSNAFATSYIATTDQNGRYSIHVEDGSWYVIGSVERVYHGTTYCVKLRPDIREGFSGRSGAIRNLTLTAKGSEPLADGTTVNYGGKLTFNIRNLPVGKYYLTLTLTPNGPLLNGETIQPIIFSNFEFDMPSSGTIPFDTKEPLPLGSYTVTAFVQQAGGGSGTLKISNVDSESPDYRTDQIKFDAGMLGCGGERYSTIDIYPE